MRTNCCFSLLSFTDGGLEKHHVTPSVSKKMISLVHKYNIFGGGESVKPSVVTILFVTIMLIVFSH